MHIFLIKNIKNIVVFILHPIQWHDVTYLKFVKQTSSNCNYILESELDYMINFEVLSMMVKFVSQNLIII
jgi:hypothetical protein